MAVTEEEPPEDLHRLHARDTVAGTYAWCRCGEWEGWWNGERGRAAVEDDHDHHRRAASNGGSYPPVQ